MPQRKTGVKELKKNRTRQMHNLDIKTDLRKTMKAFVAAVSAKPEDVKALLSTLYKKIDKAAKRNIIHKKTASRRKASFAKLLASKKA